MQHNLINAPLSTLPVPLTPVIADGVREDVPGAVEACRADGAADFGVAFEAVLGVFVPEVEGAVAAGGGEGAVDGVEGDGVDGVDVGDVAGLRGGLSVAFEGEVGAVGWEGEDVSGRGCWMGWWMGDLIEWRLEWGGKACLASFSSTYWIAHRPSILPTAKPVASLKQLTTLVCHFNGLCIVL